MINYSTILIVPCYNEEKRLIIQEYLQFLQQHNDYLLLFVDDGSRDDTSTVINELSVRSQKIRILKNHKNLGKGETVRTGFLYALENFDCQYIGFVDADLSTPLNEFENFRQILDNRSAINIVLGSRVQILGKQINRNIYRHWFSRIIATFICKIIDEPVYDTQCGAKLFRRSYASGLFKDKFISKWLFDVELLARYKKRYPSNRFQDTVIEHPVNQWTEKENSKMKYHYFFRIIFDLFRIRNHYFKK